MFYFWIYSSRLFQSMVPCDGLVYPDISKKHLDSTNIFDKKIVTKTSKQNQVPSSNSLLQNYKGNQ